MSHPTPFPSSTSTKPSQFTPTPPPRSTTLSHKPRHHIPHHPHRSHHHHHDDKSIPQSAIQPTSYNPFGDFLAKSVSKIDAGGTLTPPRQGEQGIEVAKEEPPGENAVERERRKWAVVETKRIQRKEADESHRTTLAHLAQLSTTTTRRLDYTYYALLTSLSALTATIASLHHLSTQTSTLAAYFHRETAALDAETTASIATATAGFETQEARIRNLEGRMREGRGKVHVLSARLDSVRAKVEAADVRDGEGRKRRKVWMQGAGGCVVTLVAFVVVVLVARWLPRTPVLGLTRPTVQLRDGPASDGGGLGSEVFATEEGWRQEGPVRREGLRVSVNERPRLKRRGVDAEATLRLFDEL